MSQEQNQPIIETIKNDISWIKDAVNDIKKNQENQSKANEERYVTKAEFWPVKTIVYGGAGIILVSVFGGLIALVVIKQ